MRRSVLINVLAIIAISACQQHTEELCGSQEGKASVLVTANAEGFETKSSFTWTDSAVNDLQVIVTAEDGSLVESIYSRTQAGIWFTGDVGKEYRFRAIANIGQEIKGNSLSDFLHSTATVDFNSIQSKGVPMTNAAGIEYRMSKGGGVLTIPLTRLMARVDFKLDRSLMKHADKYDGFQVKSVSLFNATTSFAPLSESGAKKSDLAAGRRFDYASSSDLNQLNQGGTISLYAFENLQGELLYGNNNPWNKVPGNIEGEENCSYLELTASYSAQGLTSEDIVYRMYLGSNATTNFDVCRNTIYRVTLFPTEEEIDGHRGSWKVSSGDWSDSRSLHFNPPAISVEAGSSNSSEVVMSPEAFEVLLNHTEWLNELGCTLSYDENSSVVSIACELDPQEPVSDYIRASSWDGRLGDELLVTVAKATNPVVDIYLKGVSANGVYISDHSIFFEAGKSIEMTKLGLTYVFKDGTEHTVSSLDDDMYKRTSITLTELSKNSCFYFEGYGARIKSGDNNIQNESALMHLSYSDEEGEYEGNIELLSAGRLFRTFTAPSTVYVSVGGSSRVNVTAHYQDGFSFRPSFGAFRYIFLNIDDEYADIARVRKGNAELIVDGISEGSCPATISLKTPSVSEAGFPPDRDYSFNINILVHGDGSLELEPDYEEIIIGESYWLSAKLYPDWNSNYFLYVDPVFESSDTDVVEVSYDGRVTGVGNGTAFITATFYGEESHFKTFTSTATVKVREEDLISYELDILPSTLSLRSGESGQVTALYRKYVNGVLDDETDVTQHSVWESSDEGIATAIMGRISARGEGNATVTATYAGLSGTVQVLVNDDEGGDEDESYFTYELVIPEEVTMNIGTSAELKAFLLRHHFIGDLEIGAPEKSDVTVRCLWESSNNDVAEVGRNSGRVSACSAGTATVTARYSDGITGSLVSNNCRVRVSEDSGLGVQIIWGSSGGDIDISF